MSGKPASVGASRAGVPGAPARVLVYVADPRQLEPGAAASEPPAAPPPSPLDALYLPDPHQLAVPRNALYRTQVDCSEQRNRSNAVFYKSANDVDGKLGVFGSPDNVPHRPDFLQIPQFLKDQNLKVDDVKVNEHTGNLNIKTDCVNSVSAVESFQSRVTLEGGDLATYQRCAGQLGPDSAMPSMHQVALQHGHNQFSESVTVQASGDGSNSGDRELSRSYVNYQVLEQSVSHQSIVNQSISILNQQVGVSRGIASEGDSGPTPQLVRTADGVVLAVLPSSVLPQAVDSTDLNTRTVPSDSPQTIIVPLGWRRIINGTSVLYISPSGTALSTLPQLRDYLQTTGTCKCGLPCPLRPETAFSFDPKVVSKAYQGSSGTELTKLCNHKRKLLATLQARANSPATPPPQQQIEQKKATAEVAVLKKKMKKRQNFPPNMTVSQMMVQRERPLNDFKPQENEHNRTVSPGVGPQRPNNGQSCLPTFAPVQQNLLNAFPQDNEPKQDTHIQRSSHYLTVSSGWITQQQQETGEGQKPSQPNTPSANAPPNVNMPVLGTNGQIIGVNTTYTKQTNYKNVMGVVAQNMIEQEVKDEKKDIPVQQNVQPLKNSVKEEESQIFCGLNQALTPEVMQKINEQQQIFIQQNQKQIEIAMKGFKTQLAENVSQCKLQNQNQYVPQGQLVIQNGAVVKTNLAKTPPWQVKRNDANNSNQMTSPNMKSQKIENLDFEESNASISDEPVNSYNSFPNNEHHMSQAMCSRVPPLPQHYNMLNQQWPNMEINKKKVKNNSKGSKKKASPTENKLVSFGGNGMRHMPDNKNEMPHNNVPSFMDDPSGYLAQQTVLLNNTISRQGINSSYDANHYDNPNCYGGQNQVERSCKSNNKPFDVANTYRGNLVPNPSPSPNNTPDSSVVSDKNMDSQVPQCCKGCNVSIKGCGTEFSEHQMRFKYMKQCSFKMETDGNLATCSPKHSFDDNPVTSSTFIDRSPLINDNCGPIQAGTVSTSNVSPTETLQPPEPSPTLSNSSRNTDTPHSSGSSGTQMQSNCSYPIPSPAYSNPGSCKENFNSNPPTPGGGHVYSFNSPGPPNNQSISGTQMMHFISNHNVNKNLMEVDNISMVGVKPGIKPIQDTFRVEPRRRVENSMPGYCPPPHLGGGPAHSLIQTCYVQTFVTTMASGFSVTRDTVTSVLAGKANTATTSINASQANFIRPPPPPSVNLATTYAIPNNQPDPFINSVNLPTSYPLHIAGTTAQNMISKSPFEMVQNVIGSLPSKPETSNAQTTSLSQMSRRPGHTTPGQILISSTGQIIVSTNQMPPPPPKTTTAVSPIQGSNAVTNVTTSVTQVVPAVGGVQQMVNQPTVVVNTLPAPFVIQPPMMAVDGQVVQQNTVMPQIGIVSGQSPNESPRQIDMKNGQSFVQGVAMLSPESMKKRSKKKKTTSITNVLQIAAPQQNPNNLMVHHTSPQHNSSPQFSPRGFQLSPNNNISPTPMLQALTIVPGKSGTPAHIVMNGQGSTNSFGSQQIITNTSPSQQINLLQPVNLINNASGVMPNFPAFQQFIVPNLGGMVMTTDGTAIIQDGSTGMPVQLQLQTVNGQNVLTPVQTPGVFAGANGGVVIRAQGQQGKMIQSQHSPGAQFLSPGGPVVVNGPGFNGQLSPLLANLSPTGVQFNAGPQPRGGAVQQDFAQNQLGQATVPLSPKRALAPGAGSRGNSTFVQQNTTIVQQQTTLVSNSHSQLGGGRSRLSIDPSVLLAPKPKAAGEAEAKGEELARGGDFVRHSVSTQTLAGAAAAGGRGKSPGAPDTTTHSPLGALEPAASPRRRARPDTTTKSPEPADASSSAMVQCVSSSEQDMAESREHAWPAPRPDFGSDSENQNMMSNVQLMRQNRVHNSVESSELHYNQNMNAPAVNNNQHNAMPMSSNYYERTYSNKQTYKRKNDFGDGPTFRTEKIMRTNYNMVHGLPKESEFENMGITSPEKVPTRQFPPTGTSSDASAIQKVFDRHNLGSGDDGKPAEAGPAAGFAAGDVVWGPVRGHAMWPGSLRSRAADGRWAVRWFGAAPAPAPALVPARRLLTLSEGLEAHHAARTNHRKSRKLNTLLENAIQEAMAELDKKSEGVTEKPPEETEEEVNTSETITETPKRSKKQEKVRNKDKHHKKNSAKLAPNLSKTGDTSRLRSSR
ncbi:nuclear receptor coactivator 6-like isoform X2 [Ostrinia furnacalis]|uniref:nuclear receptor coactivator 6-like isoform X2 n=1 Tax=Ostrinia furnacalis TaxID=93504 RepID=UPI00103ADC77|nr:nuclear receptor coactivator 6-like isoform X2 [Ostrinia furnacalis]